MSDSLAAYWQQCARVAEDALDATVRGWEASDEQFHALIADLAKLADEWDRHPRNHRTLYHGELVTLIGKHSVAFLKAESNG